ncbi:MAG TPA: fluoride efflux transporter CrcB [Solirubrobacteraceae bacterium]|nr:fluoride efflux transporter CrcB [Solirubrobacteraceae bacterium]
MSTWLWLAVAAAGSVGAIGRFLLDSLIAEHAGRDFPYGTFTVNIGGALVLGVLTGSALEGNALLIAGTATIGSYTTFSTWMLESHRLAEDRQHLRSLLNLGVSLIVGFGAVLLGHTIGAHA